MRFWDSSAVVPLLVNQEASPLVDAWTGEDPEIVVWTLTSVEVVSAIRRLVREDQLTEALAVEAETRMDELVGAAHTVVDVEAVKGQTRRLLRLHTLRAADALQLAAALEWAGGHPVGRIVHTLDERLGSAAHREGFRVIPAPSAQTQKATHRTSQPDSGPAEEDRDGGET